MEKPEEYFKTRKAACDEIHILRERIETLEHKLAQKTKALSKMKCRFDVIHSKMQTIRRHAGKALG